MTIHTKEKKYERLFKSLANRRRIAIIKYLKNHDSVAVGQIADSINISFKATSKHLQILEAADMIEHEREGNLMMYKLAESEKPINHIIAAL